MILWVVWGQATAPDGVERYLTVGGALGVAVMAALVVIRIQRTSVVDLRADRAADRAEIEMLRADRDADAKRLDAMQRQLEAVMLDNVQCRQARAHDEVRIAALERECARLRAQLGLGSA